MTKREYYCSCCGKQINHSGSMKEYGWQVDGLFQCSGSCFSKEFDKRYKASKTNIYGGCLRNTRGRVVDKGYERHGAR